MNVALSSLTHGDRVLVNKTELTWAQTFGDVAAGECLLYEDSYGRMCIAQNQGNAGQTLGLDEGSPIRISRPKSGTPARTAARTAKKQTQAGGVGRSQLSALGRLGSLLMR